MDIFTNETLNLIVKCATILSGLALTYSFLKKNLKAQEFKAEAVAIKLHFFYIVVILSLIIVGYTTLEVYDNKQVFDAVTFASSLISIILAVLTIVYSYYLNSKSSGQIDILNDAAKKVQDATNSYSNSANILHANIAQIIAIVAKVDQKTDVILNQRPIIEETKGELDNNNLIESGIDIEMYINNYIQRTSPIGGLLIYACVKSADNKKPYSLNLFGEEMSQYCFGFLIGLTSSGLVDVNIDFMKKQFEATKYVQPLLLEKIEDWINNALKGENVMIKQFVEMYKSSIDLFVQ